MALLLAFSALVFLSVRADRLRDLDAALQARAGAISGYVEYDGGWEIDPIPEHVTAPLTGWAVTFEGEPLVEGGALEGRRWAGRFTIESEGGPDAVDVTVAQDTAPLERALWLLLGELAALGLGLSGLAVGLGELLSRRIVSSEDFQRLQAAWQRQAAFTADASHELRTPLSVVRTRAEVALRRERSAAQYREALEGVLEGAQRMQELLEGLLVLARADERVERSPVDLAEVVREAVAASPGREGVALQAALPERAPTLGDARLLRVLVDNLLSNALRHTRAGAVTIRVQPEGAGWRLEVEDTGEGIAPEHLERIFERFYRADAARSRKDGGSGLGLSIVRTIAGQHEGRVEATSRLGEGTTMTVHLPGV
ncbi:MAG: hypothetical protein H6739_32570 [Alphaproteobacteria bacterium]|nr:hypothetical protein [Alphaproteobacteria bacterium]